MLRFAALPLCLIAMAAGAPLPQPAPSGPMQSGIYRGRPVTYEVIGGRPIFEGDIVLDHLSQAPGQGRIAPQSVGLAYENQLWPKTAGADDGDQSVQRRFSGRDPIRAARQPNQLRQFRFRQQQSEWHLRI
jgi:hypothetical protein